MSRIVFSLLLIMSFSLYNRMYTQPFTCDSILITNFDYTPDSLNRISLFAANANMDLISYPGFVVLNHLGDTMAKETVNYFGIGFFPQQHFLEVYQPITNPFAGTIELYSWFYDSLRCVFPFTLDTTLSKMNDILNDMSLYPNPTKDLVFISGGLPNVDFKIYDSFGRLIQTGCGNTFDLKNYKNGVYMVSLEIKEQFKTFLVYKQ